MLQLEMPVEGLVLFRKGQEEVVRMLLEHGGRAVLKDVNKRGLTALGEALAAGHVTIADQLVKVTFHRASPVSCASQHLGVCCCSPISKQDLSTLTIVRKSSRVYSSQVHRAYMRG